ncbi:unnamed protein product [Chilo suppressalis]|uniref:PWWP domain-containing protein n=1 Tax=Chilo suppressalis TaxID=168631 RepID=A0ABN8B107_CHISP|nr:unnamed protein product [Chilo suppressalis]
MCEQAEINYLDGDVVWVKLGSCWWPGEVVAPEKLPPDVLPSFRKPPIAVVKFFQEDTYEYVKNTNSIYKYNCSRKDEFITKGLHLFRSSNGHMEKFPEDIIRAETAVGGDIEILTRDEFQKDFKKKKAYEGLFGGTPKTPSSGKKGKGRRLSTETHRTPIRKEKSDYKVHILVQKSSTPVTKTAEATTSSDSGTEVASVKDTSESGSQEETTPQTPEKPPSVTTPTVSSTGIYSCHACSFSTARLNVLILHNKTHSVTFTPYTPTPVKKKIVKTPSKSTPSTSKTPKAPRPRKEKGDKVTNKKASQGQKRASEESKEVSDTKKLKTDQEIKSSLLADWDDVDEEESNDGGVMAASPEVPIAAESPAVPTPAELPNAQVPLEDPSHLEKKSEEVPAEKSESTSDSNKYEFCEDEDWPVEADVGRKIPRVKNPSKRKDETKSLSVDDDEVAREVAELLNKTTVPELPSVPEPLNVEENFPEPSIVKSPDKQSSKSPEPNKGTDKSAFEPQPTKAIFKTKTFFRSRHSRSQDAIGKYVAEQLNAVERMDMSENEINGSDVVSSPEARESPPMIEHVKVARLAPKIQLKKMKAEAAQLREKEKIEKALTKDSLSSESPAQTDENNSIYKFNVEPVQSNKMSEISNSLYPKDVLYPTQEIKPINEVTYEESKSLLLKNYSTSSEVQAEQTVKSNEILNDKNLTTVVTESVSNIISNDNNTICEKTFTSKEQHSQPVLENTSDKTETDQLYMNESTASAVDALLSVARDPDRVTKIVSDDPPEDLFEDDNRDNITMNNVNGLNETMIDDNEKSTCDLPLTDNHQEGINLLENSFGSNSKSAITETVDQPILPDDKNEVTYETELVNNECPTETIAENIPSESDLQIAEALINLPATAIHSKSIESIQVQNPVENEANKLDSVVLDNNVYEVENSEAIETTELGHSEEHSIITDNENINVRFETEQEKSENLNAAQSLVQMSESVDHKINIVESNTNIQELSSTEPINTRQNNGIDKINTVEQNVASLSSDNSNELINNKLVKYETTSSKLLKILEEPCAPKIIKKTPTKRIIIPGKEKILNFDVAKQSLKGKSQSPVIIRRAAANKTLLNNLNDIGTSEKIILSRSNKPQQDNSSMQTYTIQTSPDTPSDTNTITIIQQKVNKVPKMPTKIQKKPQNSLISQSQLVDTKSSKESKATDDSVFDINSMPIVLSEELLTPENIDKMPIVMSDGNLIANTATPPKLIKTKQTVVESDKLVINPGASKSESKTLLMNPVNEVNKVTTTPNILSKSSKLRGTKPMLVIDKATGKQKIIMTKNEPALKELKPSPTIIQPVNQNTNKGEKFILLPTATAPRPGRTQKIVIDPQTGKAHVLVAKSPDAPVNLNDNKPVSAKLIPSSSDASGLGNTVMIITNAQGAQSRIVLTSEHEKILFPNKQHQQTPPQLKTITHRISPNVANTQKQIVSSVPQVKSQTRIVPKQKSAIITSKGQLIVGGRVATTAQNIAPMPEIRPLTKRIIPAEPKKIIQTIQKTPSEPLILLQQKSGTVVQLTQSQFEQIQRTGHFIQKIPVPVENKPVFQKTITITPGEPMPGIVQKRIRRTATESPTPMKRVKQEIAIAPAPPPPPMVTLPALTPLTTNMVTTIGPSISNTVSVTTSTPYPDLDNIEEMLPSTAIARQPEPVAPVPPVLAQPEPAVAPLSDGQLLAVPGEHFGGPPGSFYLCVEDNGTLTPIDNRPLVLENNQLVPMAVEPMPMLAPQPERRDILEAALANSDVFHADPPRDEAPDFRDLNANVSVHCRVSETSTTLNQPIMTPVEVPSKVDSEPTTVPSNLEDGLAVIGVTPHTVPTSLELPITVTDPRIAPKTTDPLSGTNYGTSLLPSPNTEMTYVTTEDVDMPVGASISMPLLTDEDAVGKSMPILTDDVAERTVSSVESTIGSPSSIDVRESEMEEGTQWSRRLLTPCSDTSETSSEIPLQPSIQLSVNDMSRHS